MEKTVEHSIMSEAVQAHITRRRQSTSPWDLIFQETRPGSYSSGSTTISPFLLPRRGRCHCLRPRLNRPRRQMTPSPGALIANGTWAFPALSLPPAPASNSKLRSWWNVDLDSSPSPLPISKQGSPIEPTKLPHCPTMIGLSGKEGHCQGGTGKRAVYGTNKE